MLTGEGLFGERAAQASDVTGLSVERLRQRMRVCERVLPRRRRPELSFSHHEAVAPLAPPAQAQWLERAVRKRLTSGELKQEIKGEGKQRSPDELREAAHAVWMQARLNGDGYAVPREPMQRLAQALA